MQYNTFDFLRSRNQKRAFGLLSREVNSNEVVSLNDNIFIVDYVGFELRS